MGIFVSKFIDHSFTLGNSKTETVTVSSNNLLYISSQVTQFSLYFRTRPDSFWLIQLQHQLLSCFDCLYIPNSLRATREVTLTKKICVELTRTLQYY